MKIFLLFIIYFSFILSKLTPIQNEKLNLIKEKLNKDKRPESFFPSFLQIFEGIFPECFAELESLSPYQYILKDGKYPFIFDHIGKNLNDLGDEIECRETLVNTIYAIIPLTNRDFINNQDRELVNFLDLPGFSIGGCITELCREPIHQIADIYINFNKSKEKYERVTMYEIDPNVKMPDYVFIIYILIAYIAIKLAFGVVRLIYIPKGYENYGNNILKKSGKLSIENDEEQMELITSLGNQFSFKDHNESSYDLKLRIWKFFDLFNDIYFLSDRRNKYYNDNNLKNINMFRFFMIFLYCFYITFVTLFAFPSRDILNKTIFNSNLIFIYKLSTYSIDGWIFLEAAYTSFKLMNFIRAQMYEYNKKSPEYFKENLLKAFGKFLFLCIPQIIMFFLCYYLFYYNAKSFQNFFDAKTTFQYVMDTIIVKNETNTTFGLFEKAFFNNEVDNFKKSYLFVFTYFNIFTCLIIFMIILYFSMIIQNKIFDIIAFLLNFAFWIGFIHIINDEQNNGQKRYKFYHLKGQEYFSKIFYMTLGVYNLGFFLGILIFNFNRMRYEAICQRKKSEVISEDINTNQEGKFNINASIASISVTVRESYQSFKMPYYPFEFCDKFLDWISSLKSWVRLLLIIITVALIILLSCIYQIESGIKKADLDENANKNDYMFQIDLDKMLFYFKYEKYFFLLFLFILNILLINAKQKGFYKLLVNFNLITITSRIGHMFVFLATILCTFSFCGFLIKVKFFLTTFLLISIGNFMIITLLSTMILIAIELPLRILVKKIIRKKPHLKTIKTSSTDSMKLIDPIQDSFNGNNDDE